MTKEFTKKINQNKESLFQLLKNNAGIQAILGKGYQILNNPIAVCDSSLSMISSYPDKYTFLDFEKRNDRYYMRHETISNMMEQQLIQKLHETSKTFTFLHEITNEIMYFCNIMIHNSLAGYICIPDAAGTMDDSYFEYIEYLSDILSIEMQKYDFLTNPSGQDYEHFFTELLNSRLWNQQDIEKYISRFTGAPKRFNWIVLFQSQENNRNGTNSRQLLHQISSMISNCLCIKHEGHLVALFSKDATAPFTEYELTRLKHFLKFNQLYLCISYPFTNLTQCPVFYAQVKSMLRFPYPENSETFLFSYEDFYLRHLLSLVNERDSLSAAVHPTIFQIRHYDLTHNTEYLSTLRCYFQYNRNVTEAAEALHLHKSTFFYRMGKMEELFQIDFKKGALLFTYELSLQLLDLSNNSLLL